MCELKDNRKKYGSILEESPDLVKYLVNEDDADISIGSATKVNWICPSCGMVVEMKSVNKVVSRGRIPCPACGDGVSRPEKIVISGLRQAGIEFVPQKIFKWSQRKRYDFYLTEYNAIIEVHGSQHYGLGFANFSGVSLDEQKHIDDLKKRLADENDISKYYVINATIVEVVNVVPQLEDILNDLGVGKEINHRMCEIAAAQSNIVEAARMWNDGAMSGEIAKKLFVAPGTVIQYLKRAAAIGLCNYTPYDGHIRSQKMALKPRRRRVRCINTGEVFESIAEAGKKYNISSLSNIIRSCTIQGRHAGELNGELLSWEYVI